MRTEVDTSILVSEVETTKISDRRSQINPYEKRYVHFSAHAANMK